MAKIRARRTNDPDRRLTRRQEKTRGQAKTAENEWSLEKGMRVVLSVGGGKEQVKEPHFGWCRENYVLGVVCCY